LAVTGSGVEGFHLFGHECALGDARFDADDWWPRRLRTLQVLKTVRAEVVRSGVSWSSCLERASLSPGSDGEFCIGSDGKLLARSWAAVIEGDI